jgi:hypothetical protein
LTKQLEAQNAAHAKLEAKVSAVEARLAALEKGTDQGGGIVASTVAATESAPATAIAFKLSKESVDAGWKALDARWCLHVTGLLYDLETGKRYYPQEQVQAQPVYYGGQTFQGGCANCAGGCSSIGFSGQPGLGFASPGIFRGASFGGTCAGGVCR